MNEVIVQGFSLIAFIEHPQPRNTGSVYAKMLVLPFFFFLEHGWFFQLPAAMVDWEQASNWAAQALQSCAPKHCRLLNLNSGHLLN